MRMRVRHADEYPINRNGETILFRFFIRFRCRAFFVPLARFQFRFSPRRGHSRMRSSSRCDGERSKSAPMESVRSTASCDRYRVGRSSRCARRAAFFPMYIHTCATATFNGDTVRDRFRRSKFLEAIIASLPQLRTIRDCTSTFFEIRAIIYQQRVNIIHE